MAGHEDRLALGGGQVPQELAQPPDPFGVQAVGRLVEQQHLRVAQQRRREGEPLSHPHRVAAGPLPPVPGCRPVPGAHRPVGSVCRSRPPAPEGGRGRCDRGGDCWPQVRRRRSATGARVVIRRPADRGGARRRLDEPEQHPPGGRLAGPVGAEEAGDPAGFDGEVEIVDGGEPAKAFGEPGDGDLHARPNWGLRASRGRGRWRSSWSGQCPLVVVMPPSKPSSDIPPPGSAGFSQRSGSAQGLPRFGRPRTLRERWSR